MSAIACRRGVIVYEYDLINNIGLDKYCALKRTFTRTVQLKHNQYKSSTLVKAENTPNGKILIISRFLAQIYIKRNILKSIKNVIADGQKINITKFNCIPYPIQQTVHDYIINNHLNEALASKGFAGLSLELEAGLGKTYVVAMICKTLGLKTVYIVPSSEYLLEQAEDDFKKCFPEMKLGRYYGKAKYDGDVVFMIINSVTSKEFLLDGKKISPKEFFSRFGFAIWDESHEYATRERSKAFTAVNCKYMIGVTAEVNSREDKMDFISHYGIGLPVYADKIPGFDLPDEDRYKSNVKIIRYAGPPEYCKNLINEANGMMSASKMSKQVLCDYYRMEVIVDYAMDLYKNNHNLFVWCDTRAGVNILRDILSELGVNVQTPEIDTPLNKNVAYLMGGTTKEDIIKAQNSRVIVATYQYAYRGVSLPKFDAMIFATPRRAKIYQTLKRIFRMGGDTSIIRQIVDIVDVKTKLKNQLSDRMKQYKRELFGMTIKNIKINYSDIEPKNKLIFNRITKKYILPE